MEAAATKVKLLYCNLPIMFTFVVQYTVFTGNRQHHGTAPVHGCVTTISLWLQHLASINNLATDFFCSTSSNIILLHRTEALENELKMLLVMSVIQLISFAAATAAGLPNKE